MGAQDPEDILDSQGQEAHQVQGEEKVCYLQPALKHHRLLFYYYYYYLALNA